MTLTALVLVHLLIMFPWVAGISLNALAEELSVEVVPDSGIILGLKSAGVIHDFEENRTFYLASITLNYSDPTLAKQNLDIPYHIYQLQFDTGIGHTEVASTIQVYDTDLVRRLWTIRSSNIDHPNFLHIVLRSDQDERVTVRVFGSLRFSERSMDSLVTAR